MDFPSVGDVLSCAPSWPAQLTELVLLAILWFFVIDFIAMKIAKPWYENHPNFEQYQMLQQKLAKESYGIDWSIKDATEYGFVMLGGTVQHLLGAMLCAPAVFHLPGISWSLAATLARHGALSEAAFELEDLICRFYQIIFRGEAGRAANPPAIMIILILHHTMGLGMVMAMNIYFSENYWYFSLVFILQGLAAIAMALQQFGFFLDVNTKTGICKMKMYVTATFLLMWGGRCFAYIFCIRHLLPDLLQFSKRFYEAGWCVSVVMGLLNMLFILDATGKFAKYVNYKPTDETNISPEEKRRKSSDLAFAAATSVPLAAGAGGGIVRKLTLDSSRSLEKPLMLECGAGVGNV